MSVNIFNPLDYQPSGPVGQGNAVADTAGFNAALRDAIATNGTLRITTPTNSSSYLLNDTLDFNQGVPNKHNAGDPVSIRVEVDGSYNSIRWVGGSNKTVYLFSGGMAGCYIQGLKVSIDPNQTGVIAFAIESSSPNGSNPGFNNTNMFLNCRAVLGNGAGNVGWRIGHRAPTGGDISFIRWDNCQVGGSTASGQVGWLNEGDNTLNLVWTNTFGDHLDKMVTNVSSSGAASAQGGGSMFFYGCGGGYNNLDFEFGNAGSYIISGGRFELGKRFLNVTYGQDHPVVHISAIDLSGYAPSDGCLMHMERPGTLHLQDPHITSPTAFDQRMITFGGNESYRATLNVDGGKLATTYPFWSNYNGTVKYPEFVDVSINNVAYTLGNGQGLSVGKLPEIVIKQIGSTTYTFLYGDYRRRLETTASSPTTITIPASGTTAAIPIGSTIPVVQIGSGQVTFIAASGVMLRTPHGAKTAGQYSVVTLYKRAANEWILSGDTAL